MLHHSFPCILSFSLSLVSGADVVLSLETQLQVGEEAQTAGAANLRAYVDWFNRLSWLVAAGICQCGHKKTRVRLIEHWIEVGRACRGMRNYNSTMAVVSALNMASVRRMKRTWASVKSKSRSQVCLLICSVRLPSFYFLVLFVLLVKS